MELTVPFDRGDEEKMKEEGGRKGGRTLESRHFTLYLYFYLLGQISSSDGSGDDSNGADLIGET